MCFLSWSPDSSQLAMHHANFDMSDELLKKITQKKQILSQCYVNADFAPIQFEVC